MRKHILLVDDDQDLLALIGFYLEQAGFHLQAVADGAFALKELKQRRFDLMIMDITMPQCDGFQLLEAVRTDPQLKKMPVLVLTGRKDMLDIQRVKKHVSDYVIKPADRSDLMARIERILGGRPQFEHVEFTPGDKSSLGTIGVPVSLLSLGRNGMVILSPIEAEKNQRLVNLAIPALTELNLQMKTFTVRDCRRTGENFEYFVSFHDLNTHDRERIRRWIMSHEFKERVA